MRHFLLICAVVMGQSVLAADKKPLTKEESAKVIEAAIRGRLRQPAGELTKADLGKVTYLNLYRNQLTDVKELENLNQLKVLYLDRNQLTDVKGLEKLTKLEVLVLTSNQLTDVSGLEKLTQLDVLELNDNPGLTKVQIDQLQKALPNCKISSNPKPKTFTNTLGMPFVSVSGTKVQFCIWETRVKDYAAYAAANARVNESWKNFGHGGFKQVDTHPVVNVNWDDAQAFCAWLTKKELAEGKIKVEQKYRLPTDAEWSVAVGLGKEIGNTPVEKGSHKNRIKDVYPWGKEWPPPKGSGNYLKSQKAENFDYTSPVGSFAADKHGFHDMGGNVWEWCEDKWYPTENYRVMRGASWAQPQASGALLSSFRNPRINQDYRSNDGGFRCVLTK